MFLFSIVQSIYSQVIIDDPGDLDELWSIYFKEGDLNAITEIVQVLEWDEQFRYEIDFYLSEHIGTDESDLLIELLNKLDFHVIEKKTKLDTNYNVDAITFILLPDEKSGSIVREIAQIISSKRSTLELMKIKGAATWSLKSNSEQYKEVREHILSLYEDLSFRTQYMIDEVIIPNQ